ARTREYIASGDAFARAGKYREASVEYRNAIKVTPTSAEAHEKLADAAARAQDPQTAAGAILRVAELKPDDPAAQIRAASLYLLAGRYEDARDRAVAAVESDRADANAHLVLAQALAGLHDAARSEKELREAVRLAPKAPEPLVAVGSFHWAAGRTADAETAFRKAVALGPQHVAANQALALFFMATGRPADAEPLWRVVAASPQGLPFALVDYLVAMNRLADAEQALGDLIAREPTRDGASVRLAAVQYARGDRRDAADRAAALRPDDPSLRLLLIEALANSNQRARAIEEAQSAIARWPKAAGLHVQLAGLQATEGRTEQARRELSAALEIDPTSIAALAAVAELDVRAGRGQAALAAIDNRLRRQPDDPALLLLAARTHAAVGQYDKAETTLRRLVHDNPSNLDAFSALGRLYLATGRLDEAREQFD